MKILELHAQGFRSLKDIQWKPGDLNVVIGPNGAGKSNLLRLLELISLSARGQLGKYITNAGGVEPLLWDGKVDEIRWVTTAQDGDGGEILQYETTLSKALHYQNASEPSAHDFRVVRENLALVADTFLSPVVLLERQGQVGSVIDSSRESTEVERIPGQETLLSTAQTVGAYTSRVPEHREWLAGWSIYHDLDVSQNALLRDACVSRFEKRVDPDGQNLVNVLHTLYTSHREFKRDIDAAMQAAFGDDFEEFVFPPAADRKIQMRIRWKSLHREISAADLSDGTLRFLILLAALASPEAAPLIAIDEPETGLHPSMLPILAEFAVEASKRSQVIFSTHSPQFMDAFRDTIPDTTVACWEDGQTVLKQWSGERLQEWLKGYSLGRLFKSGELESLA